MGVGMCGPASDGMGGLPFRFEASKPARNASLGSPKRDIMLETISQYTADTIRPIPKEGIKCLVELESRLIRKKEWRTGKDSTRR